MRRRQGIRVVAAWLLLQPVGLAAEISVCPTIGHGRVRASVQSLLERRWKHVVRQGLDISCGSAALATVLRYQFGQQVTEDALIRAILKSVNPDEVKRRGGFSLLDLKRVAMSLGYRVQGYRMTMDNLKNLHLPALVPIQLRGFKHFVIYRGMVGDRVIVADPSFGNTLLEESQFAALWQGIALVVSKDGQPRAPSQLAITPDDLPIAESPEALNTFLQRTNVHTVVGPDEF